MKGLDNINKPYIPSAKTDVMATLRRLGFEPPSEDKRYQEKWARYRNSMTINEGNQK
jgi:hypothetical protein